MDIKLSESIGEHNTIEIEFRYTKGGHNYFRGGQSERGFYLHVHGCKVETREGSMFTSRSFLLFGSDDRDFKALIAAANRDNKKKTAMLNAILENVDADKVVEMYRAKDKQGIYDLVMVELIKAAAVKAVA